LSEIFCDRLFAAILDRRSNNDFGLYHFRDYVVTSDDWVEKVLFLSR
jgi:hypothetical protein